MKTTVISLALLLVLAACGTPNPVYCPQGYDNASRCHAGDGDREGPDRSRENRGGGEKEDRGEQESPS